MRTTRFLFLLSLPAALAAAGLTPPELEERLREGPPVVLIDIRPTAQFSESHIPGAINLSPRTLNPRRLPADRTPVLYDDGLGRYDARAAAKALRAAGRDDTRYLRGGLAAWETHSGPTTAPPGLTTNRVPGITYDTLVNTGGRDVAILDLRTIPNAFAPMSDEPGAPPPPSARTDLHSLLPAARILPAAPSGPPPGNPRFAILSDTPAETLPRVEATEELLVVIDDGDGSGEEIVRRLRAAGNRRVVLLTGGEEILRHQGRPGLERTGRGTQSVPAGNEGGAQ